MKKIILIAVIGIVISAGWYLLSPLWRVEERNDAFPSERTTPRDTLPVERAAPLPIKDNFESMAPEEKRAFEGAVEAVKDQKMIMADTMPASPRTIAEGQFMPRAHDVAGRAKLIEHNGARTLRFEDFETINGPNLHIYLSKDMGGDDYIDLGKIRGTKGNINYEIDAAVDTEVYKHVLVWCVPFRVLFSYAELK